MWHGLSVPDADDIADQGQNLFLISSIHLWNSVGYTRSVMLPSSVAIRGLGKRRSLLRDEHSFDLSVQPSC